MRPTMSDEIRYDTDRVADREAVANYLRSLAERVASGDPLPFGEHRENDALAATSPVEVSVRSRAREGEGATVRLQLSWDGSAKRRESDPDRDTDSDGSAGGAGGESERGSTRRGAAGGDTPGESGLAPPDDALPDPSAGTDSETRAANELERAVSFAAKGKRSAADSRFRRAVEADPADPAIRRKYANFLRGVGETDRALAQFDHASSLDPENASLRVEIANCHWSRDEPDAAADQFEHALELAPENPDILATYGRFQWEQRGDIEGAVESLRTALDIDGDHALAHLNYAVLLRQGGRMERAEKHYERAIDLGEGDATVHSEYGDYLWATGDVEEAARHYATARELGGG